MKGSRQPANLLKHLTPIAATALVLLILLATTLPLMQWWTQQGAVALLDDNRERWRRHQISNYDLALEQQCDCEAAGRYRVEVRTGAVVAAADDSGREVPHASFPSTIEAVFDEAQQRLAANPDDVSVGYDEIYGFPRRLDAGASTESSSERVSLIVTSFRPVSAAEGSHVE